MPNVQAILLLVFASFLLPQPIRAQSFEVGASIGAGARGSEGGLATDPRPTRRVYGSVW